MTGFSEHEGAHQRTSAGRATRSPWAKIEERKRIMDGIKKVLWPDGGTGNPTSAFSGIAFEEDDVPIREKILLAFEPELAGVACLLHGTRCDQVVVGDYLGLDEGVLEISVDDPGDWGRSFLCGRSRPGLPFPLR